MFCLLVVLVKLPLRAKRLARKTPLRKPNRGEGINTTKSRLKSVLFSWFNVFFSFFNCMIFVLSPTLHDILHTSMKLYSLFVLKVPLNTKQTPIRVRIDAVRNDIG